MAELRQLKFKRGLAKGSLTRLQTFFDSLNLNSLDEDDIIKLKLRSQRLEPIFDEFSNIQSEIEYKLEIDEEVSDVEKQSEMLERGNFETGYYELVSKISAIITKFERGTLNSVTTDAYNGNNGPSAQFTMSAKLPILKLPSFSGVLDKWLEFRDVFESLVENNASLDKVQRFYYLKSCLEGEAAQLIESIPVTAENYPVAWLSLKERYENKRLIVFNYLQALFDFPVLTKENSIQLRNMFDVFTKTLRSLKILGQPTEKWDILIVHLMVSKFDNRTRRDWECFKIKEELPTFDEIKLFLREKCELLEKLDRSNSKTNNITNKTEINARFATKGNLKTKYHTSQSLTSSQNSRFSCYFCKKEHSIFKCDAFVKLKVSERDKEVRKLKLCLNCFNPNHSVQDCEKSPCRVCSKKHNTLLHKDTKVDRQTIDSPTLHVTLNHSDDDDDSEAGGSTKNETKNNRSVPTINALTAGGGINNNSTTTYCLLSTAVVNIIDKKGNLITARILLDPGSQSNFVTESLANKLGFHKTRVNYSISGVGNNDSVLANYKMTFTISSRISKYSREASFLILPKITQQMPSFSFDIKKLNIPTGVALADPNFNEKSNIDILFGVGLFYDLLLQNQLKLQNGLVIQNTRLGWVLGGELSYPFVNNTSEIISCHSIDTSVESLEKFWRIEECDDIPKIDNFCETHFMKNTERDFATGRFVVKIPFDKDENQLNDSKDVAIRRFYLLEKKLEKNKKLKEQYSQFMSEYESLGHMRKLCDSIENLSDSGVYYIPHHAVFKETSLTTKLRVVFDASAKKDSGVSLNDMHKAGPIVQSELFDILLRFRQYSFVINADVTKMYRQIRLNHDHTRFHRIFWRSESSDDLKCYELLTVTYGVAASPFLATRCLLELAIIEKDKYPLACEIISDSFYVDDLLAGSNSEKEILQLQRDITTILATAGFELRKWLSNRPDLCEKFTINSNSESSILHLGENESSKTLGILWDANSDTIQYCTKEFSYDQVITKRAILSTIGRLFDPLGLLGPVIMTAKIILQLLWREKVSWDQPVSNSLSKRWIEFLKDLQNLQDIKINRHVLDPASDHFELHIFVDACEKGYGAAAYIRSQANDNYFCSLLCAKSKVAPIKQVTLPRLELCAAVLGAKLSNRVKRSLKLNFEKCYFWTDSLITYHWINGSPDRWKTFIANRVSVIQNLTDCQDWHHVASKENPADCISRGTTASNLLTNTLWWKGPFWIENDISQWPSTTQSLDPTTIPEQRVTTNLSVFQDFDLFVKFSSLNKLKRVTAYFNRFIFNIRNPKTKRRGQLSVTELNEAEITLIKIAQLQSFSDDYKCLKSKGNVHRSSNILILKPFLHSDGLIRVGGRLSEAAIPYDKQHQIILHNKHPLTKIILISEHKRLLHCGPQQLLYSIRERYWPICGRNLCRLLVNKCITCFKVNPKFCEIPMGNLPSERVNQCFPFVNTGCDYAGPFMLKDRKTRKPILTKAWICIFVCMSTKAVHLDLVTNLTSTAFLACLKRFIARRGKPNCIFSDNGTAFVGANSELLEFFKEHSCTIERSMNNEGITWKFIPAKSPNFGGLWEAGVKRIKYHLKRIIGSTPLHFDDFFTALNQIESVLNSRPLSPMSSSPDDYTPLTPGHFLIGRPLTALPEPDLTAVPTDRLSHYNRLQQILQHFWRRWSREYITELQSRLKWHQNSSDLLTIGSLVLVKDDNVPPLHWRTARVKELHPGTDNITRVVTVQFSNGSVVKRSARNLCVLPV